MTGVLFKRGNLGMEAHTGRLSYEDEDRNEKEWKTEACG